MRNNYLLIRLLLLFASLTAGIASAQSFTNGSFTATPSSGNPIPGWTVAGLPVISVGASTPVNSPYNTSGVVYAGPAVPVNGTNQVLVNSTGTTSPDIYAMANAVDATTLNTFLGTTLQGNGNGAVVNGQAIKQVFSTTTGATITFSYAYESRETPGNGYDETGYVLNGVFHLLADTSTPNQNLTNTSGFFIGGGIPYQTVTVTVGPGTTTLGFVAYNTGNTNAPSGLFIDNVVVTPPPPVTYATLSIPSASDISATAVSGNNVVGSYPGSDTNMHGFFYDGTNITTVDPGGSLDTEVSGVSGSNVVGIYEDSTRQYGFLFDAGTNTYTQLNPPGSSSTTATAVSGNNVAGWFIDSNGQHGFFYDGGTGNYTQLDPVAGATNTIATAISGNNVVGYFDGTDGQSHGFIFDGTTFTILDPTMGAPIQETRVTGISGSKVVGWYVINGQDGQHGFIYDTTTSTYTTAIDPPGSLANNADTTVTGVSGNSVVGFFYNGQIEQGFLYDAGSLTFDSNSPLNPPSSVDTEITAISGDNLVGTYQDSGGNDYSFLAGVNKTAATVTLDNLFTRWDGTPKSPTVTTASPAGLNVAFTYTGIDISYPTSATPPIEPGSYTVLATVVDPNYSGTAGGTLVISKASPGIDLNNNDLNVTYDGNPKAVAVVTTPANLNVIVTYTSADDNSYPSSTIAPTDAKRYVVTAAIDPTDPHYTGTAPGILVISQATAIVSLPQSSSATFDGTPKAVTATTNPTGVGLTITYTNSTYPVSTTAPSAVGTYTVVATITDPNYQGSPATGSLTISGNSSTVAFSDWENSFPNSSSFTDRAAADTPFNDGVPNALKYLYNIDPTRPMTMEDRAVLPELGTATIQGTQYLTLTFREYGHQAGMNVTVQRSNDMVNWFSSTPSTSGEFFLNVTDTNQTTGDMTMVGGVAINGAKTFIRLNVTGP